MQRLSNKLRTLCNCIRNAFRGYDVKAAPNTDPNDFYIRGGNCATFFSATENDWEDISGIRNSQVYNNIVERLNKTVKKQGMFSV